MNSFKQKNEKLSRIDGIPWKRRENDPMALAPQALPGEIGYEIWPVALQINMGHLLQKFLQRL